jgi:filamentous hemagglutinin family protein
MNRIYRLVWNRSLKAWVAASEHARGRGKGAGRGLAGAALSVAAALAGAMGAGAAHATPQGGQVVGGSGSIAQSGAVTTITQASQNLSVNWQSFNVGAQQTVDFVQPGASAVAINRIGGNSASQIYGHLDANGLVYLINPDGVVFGPSAQVDVGGLVASTLELTGGAGTSSQAFSGAGAGSVINEGTIRAAAGGTVALLGDRVINHGSISARLGTVALGAGSAVTLSFDGQRLVSLRVQRSVLATLAANGGLIQADGGRVILSAGAKDALLASVVNNTGVIEARTVQGQGGTIRLLGGMEQGTVDVGGVLDASAPTGGNGGAIETSAAHVQVAATARVSTAAAAGLSGTWLIDPTDFTIAASGGDITGATLSTELGAGNVTILSSSGTHGGSAGNINVDDAVTWSNHLLTLTATNDVNINAVMTANNTASLDLEPGSGNVNVGISASTGAFLGQVNFFQADAITPRAGTGFLTIDGHAYTVVTSLGAQGSTTGTDLQGIDANLAGYFALGTNIDATATSGWNGGLGFTPIGSSASIEFTGTFDGLGHTISNLTIDSPSNVNLGLFGWIGASAIARNVGLVGGSVYGQGGVGALAGASYGIISHVYASTAVTGLQGYVGGLVGTNLGKISNSYATGNITAGSYGGGLAGYNGPNGTIADSYAAGSVSSEDIGGGVVGANYGTITASHATGAVGYGSHTGGLAGENFGAITNSYATGNVAAGYGNSVGGLVGTNSGSIANSYATGSVSGTGGENSIGGLVGSNGGTISASYATGTVTTAGANAVDVGGLSGTNAGTITASYATGAVSASGYAQKDTGGLVGYNNGPISASYATGAVSGIANVGGLVGYSDTLGTISTSYATGGVTGASAGAGGLVGASYGSVASSHATGAVSAAASVGGLVGELGGEGPGGPVTNSYATGAVSGVEGIGGLVGYSNGEISTSYATGNATATAGSVGGLVGYNVGSISISFATGTVTGGLQAGGLVGNNSNSSTSTIANSYATGSVSGAGYVGGLVGSNSGLVDKSYSSGSVSAPSNVGGLVGAAASGGTVTNSFWDTTTSGQTASAGGVGLSTAQLRTQANFNSATSANGGADPAWDFASTWFLYAGETAPLLRYFLTPLTISGATVTQVGDTPFAIDLADLVFSITPDPSLLLGTLSFTGQALGAHATGTYDFTPSGLYSGQLGYLITFVGGTLKIVPAPAPGASNPTLTGAVAQAQGILYTPPVGRQPGTLDAEPTLVAAQVGASAVGAEGGVEVSAGGADSVITLAGGKAIAVNVNMKIGAVGTLQIQNGGMLLPADLVDVSP